jgi:hypothetical protein
MNSVVLFGLREWPVYLDCVVITARVPHLFLSNIPQNAKFSGKVQELIEGHICPFICFISKTYHSISIKFPVACCAFGVAGVTGVPGLCRHKGYGVVSTSLKHITKREVFGQSA